MMEEQVMVTTTMSPEQWAHIVQSLAELRAYKESEAKMRGAAPSSSEIAAASSSTSISALKRAKRKKKKQQQAAAVIEEVKAVSNSFSSPPAKRLHEILEAPRVSPVPPTSPTPAATRVQREQRDQRKALGPETDSTPAPPVVKKSSPAPTPKPAPSVVAVPPKERIAKKKPRTAVRVPVKTESFIDVDSWNLALPLWFLVGVVVRFLSSLLLVLFLSIYSQPSPPPSQAWLVYSNGLSGAFVFNDSAAIVKVRFSLPTSRAPLT
jgi:hypothetical protein